MPQDTNPWFPAKEYGWGWGIPIAWQGWVTVAMWSLLLGGGLSLLLRLGPVGIALSVVYMMLMAAVLLVVCYIKGETLRWRNGRITVSSKRVAVFVLFMLVLIGTLGLGFGVGGAVALRLL